MYTKTQIEKTIKVIEGLKKTIKMIEGLKTASERRVCDNGEDAIYMYALAHALGIAIEALEEMPTREEEEETEE